MLLLYYAAVNKTVQFSFRMFSFRNMSRPLFQMSRKIFFYVYIRLRMSAFEFAVIIPVPAHVRVAFGKASWSGVPCS